MYRAVRVGDDGQVGGRQRQDGQNAVIAVCIGDGVQVQQGAVAVIAPVGGGDAGFITGIIQSGSSQFIPAVVGRAVLDFDDDRLPFDRALRGGHGLLQHVPTWGLHWAAARRRPPA